MKRYFISWENRQFVKYGNNLSRKREARLFTGERLIVRQIPSKLPYSILSSYVEENLVNDNNGMIVKSISSSDIKYLQAVLSSKLISFWFIHKFGKLQRKVFPQFKVNELRKFPIKNIDKNKQSQFVDLVDIMLDRIKKFNELEDKLSAILHSDFPSIYINEMWFDWWKCDYSEFIQQLKKQKIILNGALKDDWYDRFNRFKQQAVELKSIIEKTDKEIDTLVYQLYDLTDEEIKIIEGK